ncbi:Uma2 family endonuclease [Pseudenhygromyxa sp. WMMC2535]|uniref:Uma2 family endonuclease n=1 Tax=Pseudenhygromyxa sp. WMMC2535 TaxID=2712867 RepID=UPI001555332A|nr:Uma2 family endonuclease [Pseudenhygromyxa sp. WMMC2535]NVB39478.1 Uma2 family endonuclease [Pseudenhygromyxa sp. WMMC2535]
MAEAEVTCMSYAEYLRLERGSDTKHEYLRGEVYAMAGGTPEHAALIAAVTIELGVALRDRACRVYGSDLRVRVQATDLSTYPDVSVVCGPLETADEDGDAALNPILIVEVLSDSTEAYDRGQKFAHYRRLPSLRHYVLVSQGEARLEVYSKGEDGAWIFTEAGAGEAVELGAIGVSLEVDRVYRDPLA